MPPAYLKAISGCDKIPYLTEQMAWNQVRRIYADEAMGFHNPHPERAIVAYLCRVGCGCWHVGHDRNIRRGRPFAELMRECLSDPEVKKEWDKLETEVSTHGISERT